MEVGSWTPGQPRISYIVALKKGIKKSLNIFSFCVLESQNLYLFFCFCFFFNIDSAIAHSFKCECQGGRLLERLGL